MAERRFRGTKDPRNKQNLVGIHLLFLVSIGLFSTFFILLDFSLVGRRTTDLAPLTKGKGSMTRNL